jgi:hypothetical protein
MRKFYAFVHQYDEEKRFANGNRRCLGIVVPCGTKAERDRFVAESTTGRAVAVSVRDLVNMGHGDATRGDKPSFDPYIMN